MVYFKYISIGSENRAIEKKGFFYDILIELKKYRSPMLIMSICKGMRGFVRVDKEIYYYCFPSLLRFFLSSFFISKYMKSKALISQDPFVYGLYSFIVKKTDKNRKLFIEVHSDFFTNKRWRRYRTRNVFLWLLGLYIMEKADKVRFVFNDKVMEKILKNKYLFVPSNYTKLSEKKKNNKKRTYDVLFVGALHPQKNIAYMLKIVVNLLKKGYRVLIIGKGDKKYERLIKRIKSINNNVEYIPYTYNIEEYYNNSKVLLITSHAEGGPRVAFEALYYNMIVLTTPTGHIKDYLSKNKECGAFLTYDLEKDVEIIINYIKNYTKLKKKCKYRAPNYKEMIKNYGKTYEL